MHMFNVYDTYEEASFVARPNRFVMVLRAKDGRTIQASVPNTGRMEEFCSEGRPFFVTPMSRGKYPYKMIATRYQDHYVFLDTIKVNALFWQLLTRKLVPQFPDPSAIRREVSFDRSRFDFMFRQYQRDVIVEIKSCTLCHNRLAMFPDAPTLRGQRHLADLERLARETDAITYVIFLILNASAERFVPNFHTDFDYGNLLLSSTSVNIRAFKLNVVTPASVDLESLQEVPIDWAAARTHCQDKGSYLLILENPEDCRVEVGRLGEIAFRKGWYVYVGSALRALDARIKRHLRKRKSRFWHIDYLASTVMKVRKVYPIRRAERIESDLARALEQMSDASIAGFGASDSPERSHLFYFGANPARNRHFIEMLFDARTL